MSLRPADVQRAIAALGEALASCDLDAARERQSANRADRQAGIAIDGDGGRDHVIAVADADAAGAGRIAQTQRTAGARSDGVCVGIVEVDRADSAIAIQRYRPRRGDLAEEGS